jgi:hypothetical protein
MLDPQCDLGVVEEERQRHSSNIISVSQIQLNIEATVGTIITYLEQLKSYRLGSETTFGCFPSSFSLFSFERFHCFVHPLLATSSYLFQQVLPGSTLIECQLRVATFATVELSDA